MEFVARVSCSRRTGIFGRGNQKPKRDARSADLAQRTLTLEPPKNAAEVTLPKTKKKKPRFEFMPISSRGFPVKSSDTGKEL